MNSTRWRIRVSNFKSDGKSKEGRVEKGGKVHLGGKYRLNFEGSQMKLLIICAGPPKLPLVRWREIWRIAKVFILG